MSLTTKYLREHWPAVLTAALFLALGSRFVHSDLQFIAWVSHYVGLGDFDVYAAVAHDNPQLLEGLTYPPLTYWLFGAWMRVGEALFGLFHYYVAHPEQLEPARLSTAECIWLRVLFLPFVFWLPSLVIRAAKLMGVDTAALGRSFTYFVLWQPVVICTSFMEGQFDIIPTTLGFAGVVFALEGSWTRGVLLLTAGASIKHFPVVYLAIVLPTLFIFDRREHARRRLGLGLVLSLAMVFLAYSAVWGDALKQSYLRFAQHGRVLHEIAFGSITFSPAAYALALLVCIGLASERLGLWLQSRPERQLLHAARNGLPPTAVSRLVLLLCAAATLGIFVNRLWWSQYLTWLVPWICVVGVYVSARSGSIQVWLLPLALNLADGLLTTTRHLLRHHQGHDNAPLWDRLHLPASLPWVMGWAVTLALLLRIAREALDSFVTEPGPDALGARLQRSFARLMWSNIALLVLVVVGHVLASSGAL